MEDVQGRGDDRGIAIRPRRCEGSALSDGSLDRREGKQQTVGVVTASASVPATDKGTHMSRFVEVLHEHVGELTINTIPNRVRDLRERLGAEQADMEVGFPYFLPRAAPVTGATGLMDYDCWFRGSEDASGDSFVLGVRTPVTSLCPCSKEISDYGAHNQRGHVEVHARRAGRRRWCGSRISWRGPSGRHRAHLSAAQADRRATRDDAGVRQPGVRRGHRARRRGPFASDPRVALPGRGQNQESIHNHDAFARRGPLTRLARSAGRRLGALGLPKHASTMAHEMSTDTLGLPAVAARVLKSTSRPHRTAWRRLTGFANLRALIWRCGRSQRFRLGESVKCSKRGGGGGVLKRVELDNFKAFER